MDDPVVGSTFTFGIGACLPKEPLPPGVCQSEDISCHSDSALAKRLLASMPLAHSSLLVLGFVLNHDFLSNLFEEHRNRCYHDILSFPCMVRILSDALLRFEGSGRAALNHANDTPTENRTFYDKLKRTPLELSVALVGKSTAGILTLLPSFDDPLPACFADFDVGILDGKKIKNVAKRLLETRGQPGKLHGAMAIAWYDPRRLIIRGFGVNRDGESNENNLVAGILDAAHESDTKTPRLWLVDSLYCDLVQMELYSKWQDSFVVRYHPKLSFHADPARPAREFYEKKTGRWIREEWGFVGSEGDPRRKYVRRVHWLRGRTKTDQTPLIVVTNLLDEKQYGSDDVITLYLQRWGIETVFQEITAVFNLRKLVGCTPEAVTLQLALSMVMYNVLKVVWAYVGEVGPEKSVPVRDLSTWNLFCDMREQWIVFAKTGEVVEWSKEIVTPRTAGEVQACLRKLLAGEWKDYWKKARNPKKRTYGPKPKGKSAHTSVHRLQQKAKEARAAKAQAAKAQAAKAQADTPDPPVNRKSQ